MKYCIGNSAEIVNLHEPAATTVHAAGELALSVKPSLSASGDKITPLPSPDELYTKLVDVSHIPNPPASDQSLELRFVADNAVQTRHGVIELTPDELFLFNGFALLRDEPRRSAEIRNLGFRTTQALVKTAFSTHFRRLTKKLAGISGGFEIIRIEGRGKRSRYVVYEHALFTDGRNQEETTNLPEPLFPSQEPPQTDSTPSETTRDRQTAVMPWVKKYQDHPEVGRQMRHYYNTDAPSKPPTSLDRSLSSYMHAIQRFRLLTAAEEVELATKLTAGIDVYREYDLENLTPEQEKTLIDATVAYQAFYCTNLRLVASLARRYVRKDMLSYMDLIQEGNRGLANAILKFDVTKGNKFSTYATWWIKQVIGNALAATSRTIRMPTDKHEQWLDIKRKKDLLTQQLGREPQLEELANYTGTDPDYLAKLLIMGQTSLFSLNTLIADGHSHVEFGDTLVDPNKDAHAAQDVIFIEALCNTGKLSRLEKLVVSFTYSVFLPSLAQITLDSKLNYEDAFHGSASRENLTADEVAALLGIDSDAVKQARIRALGKLKRARLQDNNL